MRRFILLTLKRNNHNTALLQWLIPFGDRHIYLEKLYHLSEQKRKREKECSHPCCRIMAYMMWFHASGSPATHQCVQSHPCRPRAGVHGRVRVDPELRHRGDVQQRHRRGHGADHAPHDGLLREHGRLAGVRQRPRLVEAAAASRGHFAVLLLRPGRVERTRRIRIARSKWSTEQIDRGVSVRTCSGWGRCPGRRRWCAKCRCWRRPSAPTWRAPWRMPPPGPCPGTCCSRPEQSPTCSTSPYMHGELVGCVRRRRRTRCPRAYTWLLPLYVHQCQVLKTSRCAPSHALALRMESSFSTRPTSSSTTSTRNAVWYSTSSRS
jgi:hypothetical protein